MTSPVTSHVTAFANYSYQGKPDVNFDLSEVNLPPTNRFNIGFNFSRDRYIGDLTITYAGGAFWQDVLDDRYHGTTDPYTLVNGGAGVRWAHNHLTTSVKVINLFNENVQQHVFGDILKRQVVGELKGTILRAHRVRYAVCGMRNARRGLSSRQYRIPHTGSRRPATVNGWPGTTAPTSASYLR